MRPLGKLKKAIRDARPWPMGKERPVLLTLAEADALIAESEQRERKVERLIRASAAVADPGLHAQELYKGPYGSGSRLWREYEEAVAALRAKEEA